MITSVTNMKSCQMGFACCMMVAWQVAWQQASSIMKNETACQAKCQPDCGMTAWLSCYLSCHHHATCKTHLAWFHAGYATLTCKIEVSNSIWIRKFQNNPKQCAHPKMYISQNIFEPFSSRFESFLDRFAPFSHRFLRRFGVIVVATSFSASSFNRSK